MDDSYTSHFRVGSPQDTNYDPRSPGDHGAVNLLSARVGIRRDSWDVSLFSKNLLNTHPLLLVVFHDLPTSDLFADQTVPPRVVGITGTYRF